MAFVYDTVASTTLQAYIPTMQDNIFKSRPLLKFIAEKCMTRPKNGRSLMAPTMVGKNTNVGGFEDYDAVTIAPQAGMTSAEYYWTQSYVGLSISGNEKRINKGKEGVISLLEEKTKQAEESYSEWLNGQFFGTIVNGGDPTGANKKAYNGIAGLIGSSATGEATSVGRILVADAPTWVSYQDGTNAVGSGVLTVDKLNKAVNSASPSSNEIDFQITTQALFEKFHSLMLPNLRYEDVSKANVGFRHLTHLGIPVFYDAQCPTGAWFGLSSKHLKFSPVDGAWFKNLGFREQHNVDASYAMIITQGQLWTDSRRSHFKLVGATA